VALAKGAWAMTDEYDKNDAQKVLALEVGDTLRGLWKHYKGGLYIVFSESVDEATGAHLVHYYSIEKRTRWTRTIASFTEPVPVERVGSGLLYEPRFVRIRLALDDESHQAAFDNERVFPSTRGGANDDVAGDEVSGDSGCVEFGVAYWAKFNLN
jgi:hypothetical protein